MYQTLDRLSRRAKKIIWFSVDVSLIPISLYLAFSLRFGMLYPAAILAESWVLFPTLMLAGAVVIIGVGLPKVKLASYEIRAIMLTGLLAGLLIPIGISFSMIMELDGARSVPVLCGVLFFLASISARIFAQLIMRWLYNLSHKYLSIIIYGAGAAGVQLASALRYSQEVRAIAFVDDNIALRGLLVAGLPVHSPSKLAHLVSTLKIERILVAIPSASLIRRRELTKDLSQLPCEVQILPSYVEMIDGKGLLESLRPISSDALLGREKIDLALPEVIEAYAGKSILISGAGGSIGAELSTQALSCKPSSLILYDHSEYALYTISQQLRPFAESEGIKLVTILGSVCDAPLIRRTLIQQKIQVILHAAAYKHVPLVECNELTGLYNNVFGTKIIAEAARETGVERFILISTDKAVRPTNVMGASKRLAELIVQDLANRSETTLFSMVRFGNVLGSSGSVIPLFREQIAKGGPITLTHPNVTRYFMTIPEAARLVLVAGSFAKDGHVFVLDMGKPILIKDLARNMVELSGLTVRDEACPEGDIEITTVGLRPGEKLYEELLIGENTLETPHPKILCAQEAGLSEMEIVEATNSLQAAIAVGDIKKSRELMVQWISGYH